MYIETAYLIHLCISALAILTSAFLANPFFRFNARREMLREAKARRSSEGNHIQPAVSIVLMTDRDAEKLDRKLDIIFRQDYNADFEVVVVTEKGDSEVQDVLKRRADEPRLHSTFIPATSRYMSTRKLGITLGVKAAKYEWIVLLDADTAPISEHWLSTLTKYSGNDNNLTIGYSNYQSEDSKGYYRYERLLLSHYLLPMAGSGKAYIANGTNFMFRRKEFIEQDGYRGNLQYAHGEYDFIVNKLSHHASGISIMPDAWCSIQQPSGKQWRNSHLAFIHLVRRFRGSWRFVLPFWFDTCILHGVFIGLLVGLAYHAIYNGWPYACGDLAILLLFLGLRCWMARRASNAFAAKISFIKTPIYELSVLWRKAFHYLLYTYSSKIDYSTHKI